jgi:hypothetical protein
VKEFTVASAEQGLEGLEVEGPAFGPIGLMEPLGPAYTVGVEGPSEVE